MVTRRLKFRGISSVLFVLSCGPHAGDPKVAAPGPTRIDAPTRRVGASCTPAGVIVDESFSPVDKSNMASAGRLFLCAPVRTMSGRVVDDASRSPVARAIVTVEYWHPSAPIVGLRPNRELLKAIDVRTDAQGRWKVPEESFWMPLVLDGLPFVLSSYCIRAAGYGPFVIDPWKQFVIDPWKQGSRRGDDVASEIGLRVTTGSVEKPDPSLCGLSMGPPL